MSTPADVEAAILALIGNALYPSVPVGMEDSTAGMPVKLHRGWPQMEELNEDVRPPDGAPARAHIAVNRYPGMTRNVTRYMDVWEAGTVSVPTLTGTVDGSNVLLTGTAASAQLLGIGIGMYGYAVAVEAGSTAAEVAAAVAAVVNRYGHATATVEGATVSLAAGTSPMGNIFVRTAGVGIATREVARVSAGFLVSVFAGSIEDRDAIEAILLPALCVPTGLDLPDGGFPLLPVRTVQNDTAENADVYRVDWVFSTEYAISQSMQAAAAMFVGIEVLTVAGDPIAKFGQFYPGS